jgi:hypothetical protein
VAAGGGTGAGVWAVEGMSAGDLVSAGGGTGAADGAGAGVADGLGVGEAAGAGDCASAVPPNASAAIGISAIMAERKVLIRFI